MSAEATVARTVLIHGPISRSALAVRMGMSPASLTRLTKTFIHNGILVELGEVADGVGRPSRPLDVSSTIGTFLGVKLTGDEAHCVLTDVHAQLLAEVVVPLPSHEPAAVATVIADAMERVVTDGPRPVGIGVTLGGIVTDDRVAWGPYLQWDDVPFGELLSDVTALPVRVENDLVALTEAERWFGVVRGMDAFSVLTIGVGIGYGVVSGGEVVRNSDSGISLAAHIPLEPHGPLCPEGHRGCAQAMLGSGSIAAQASTALQRPVSFDEVLRLAGAGDPVATSVVNAGAGALGRLIALVANLTLHRDIVLAGEGMSLFGAAEGAVRSAITAHRDPRASEVRLHVDDSGFTAWARGAAAVAIQDTFERLTSTR